MLPLRENNLKFMLSTYAISYKKFNEITALEKFKLMAKKPAKEAKKQPKKEAKAEAKPKAKAEAKPAKPVKVEAKPLKKAAVPAAEVKAEKPAKAPKEPKAPKLTKAEKAAIKISSEDQKRWLEYQEKHGDEKPQKYTMAGQFEAQKPIEHPKFGWGFILTNIEDRLEVVFESGIKFLISNRKL
jgi:hypothetical protein